MRVVNQSVPPSAPTATRAIAKQTAPPVDIFRDALGLDVETVNELLALAEGQNDVLLAEGPGTNQMPGGGPPPPGGPVATDAPTGPLQGAPAPGASRESIVDDLETIEKYVQSLPSAQALSKLPRRVPLGQDSSVKVEMYDALTLAGFDPDEGTFTETASGIVKWTSEEKDGEVTVSGWSEAGQVVISRQFEPFTNERLAQIQAEEEAKRLRAERALAQQRENDAAKAVQDKQNEAARAAANAALQEANSHTATRAANVPDTLNVPPPDSNLYGEIFDALQHAGIDPREAHATGNGDDDLTLTLQRADGVLVVRGRILSGKIVLEKTFTPTGGQPIKITSSGNLSGTPLDQTPEKPSQSSSAPPVSDEALKRDLDTAVQQVFDHLMIEAKKTPGARTIKVEDPAAEIPLTDNTIAGLKATQGLHQRQLMVFLSGLSSLSLLPREQKEARIKTMLPLAFRLHLWDLLWKTHPIDTHSRVAIKQYDQIVENTIARAEERGDTELANSIRDIMARRITLKERELLLRQQFVQTLDADPLLMVNDLWTELGAGGNPADYVDEFDETIRFGVDQTHKEIIRLGDLSTSEELSAEFLQPKYARTRQLGMHVFGGPFVQLFKNLDQYASAYAEVKQIEDNIEALKVALFTVVVGGFGVLIAAPLVYAGTAVSIGAAKTVVAASGVAGGLIQLGYDGYRLYVLSGDLANAQRGAPAIGAKAVVDLQEKVSAARKGVLLDLGFVAISALQVRAAYQEMRAARLAKEAEAVALAEARAALDGERRLANVIPNGTRARVSDLPDGAAVLNRIDAEALTLKSRPRSGVPGDPQFFTDAGLVPKKTLEVGGQTFHITRPFQDGEGHIVVLAFQETGAGKVIPRTWYVSNSHGSWRVTPTGGGWYNKGPVKLVDQSGREIVPSESALGRVVEHKPVNETAADLAAELQGPLSRWIDEQPLLKFESDAVRDRAVMGHLEDGVESLEFGSLVKRADVEIPLPSTTKPDFKAGPLDASTITHPKYGQLETFVFRSEGGEALYTVHRAGKDVWISSIQVGDEFVTRFGTRASAYHAPDLTKTPLEHGAGAGYVRQSFANDLTKQFADALPPPGGVATPRPAPATATSDAAATVINPGRQAAAGTFAPARPGMPSRQLPVQSDDVLLGNARAEIQTGYPQQWKGLELQRIQQIVRNPADFRSMFGYRLTPEDLARLRAVLDKHVRATMPSSPAREIGRATLNSPTQGASRAQVTANIKNEIARAGITVGEAARGLALEYVRRASRIPATAAADAPLQVPVTSLGTAAAAANVARNVTLTLTALGKASGDSFRLDAVNNGSTPVTLEGTGVVIEPTEEAPPSRAQSASAGGAQQVSTTLEAYCLDRPLAVAAEGMQYRVASPELQAKGQSVVHIVEAGHHLHEQGRLSPDSNPEAYREFTIQWGIWSELENLDPQKFTELFLNQTKENVEARGVKWTREMETVVRQAAPSRWRDIELVREEANRTKRGEKPSIRGAGNARVASSPVAVRAAAAGEVPVLSRMPSAAPRRAAGATSVGSSRKRSGQHLRRLLNHSQHRPQ